MLIEKVWWQHVDIVEEYLQKIRMNSFFFDSAHWKGEEFSGVFMYIDATLILSVNIYINTSSKKGLFPLLMRVLWVSPQTFIFTTGFMLFPGNWRPSMTRTRILIMKEKSDHLKKHESMFTCFSAFDGNDLESFIGMMWKPLHLEVLRFVG